MKFYNPEDPKSLEKYSSAISLSDMEIFIFPDLLFSLVLANIMSPLLWKWKNETWFQKTSKLNDTKRLLRLRQFIMDNFAFNLDLDTWGLTEKSKELNRFKDFISLDTLQESNALFGYEGDKYYFDIDIRRHFGLDKYNSEIIPYWKTETVEAMQAFKHKPDYTTGAGECVSLSTLYAAMLFVNIDFPLDQIFLMATPLHSQNFLNINEGVLTNNRRLVTKSMWFNGTEISGKARRALENEQVTMVSHCSGYLHSSYQSATINKENYLEFRDNLSNFINTNVVPEIFAGFLRQDPQYQKCFQMQRLHGGKKWFIELEKVFHYEHSSNCKVGDRSQSTLLKEIEIDEFYPEKIEDRIVFQDFSNTLQSIGIDLTPEENIKAIAQYLPELCHTTQDLITALTKFCHTKAKLSDLNQTWEEQEKIDLSQCKQREEVIEYLESIRDKHPVADLAFSAFRDLKRSPWQPFLKAAFERNPVVLSALKGKSAEEAFQLLESLKNQSIYDGTRLAQPDEVWNFKHGDGIEKAIGFINFLKHYHPDQDLKLDYSNQTIQVKYANQDYLFTTNKTDLDIDQCLDLCHRFYYNKYVLTPI